MPSGAGLNRVGTSGGVVLLTLTPAAGVVTLPAYGTVANDSMGNGTPTFVNAMVEAMGFSKWQFNLVPAPGSATFSGYSVTILGTNDSRLYAQWEAAINPMKYYGYAASPTVPAGSWFQLAAPADQTGTGTDANPLTFSTPSLFISRDLTGVRAVLTASASASGSCQVIGQAIP